MLIYLFFKLFARWFGKRNMIFNVENIHHCEIGEALLIDGASPIDINHILLQLWWEDYRNRPNFVYQQQPTRKIIANGE